MCGRYNILPDAQGLLDGFRVILEVVIRPQYNVAPAQVAPVVIERDGRLVAVPMRWGFVPHWQKDAKPKFRPINARDDHVNTSGMFRESWQRRRCLVPASGFYEWLPDKGKKTPYLLHRKDGQPFFMAGIWDRWAGADAPQESFAIITTSANDVAATVHDRMPVMLRNEAVLSWMEDLEEAKRLLAPYPSDLMEAYPVSTRVNSPKNDDASLILPSDKRSLDS